MKTILCGNCGEDSGIESSGNDGRDAAYIQKLDGWRSRLPIMVGIAEWFHACSKDCMKELLARAYREHGVTEEARREANEKLEEMKAKIPALAAETARVMDHFQKRLLLIRSGFAGVEKGTGMIVDCREDPTATPIRKNAQLGVPASQAIKMINALKGDG